MYSLVGLLISSQLGLSYTTAASLQSMSFASLRLHTLAKKQAWNVLFLSGAAGISYLTQSQGWSSCL